jgi:hypothetical protein
MNTKFANDRNHSIHDNCFIGLRAVLMPGIEIILMPLLEQPVWTHDVAPNTVVAGNPVCNYLLDDYIEQYHTKSILWQPRIGKPYEGNYPKTLG